MIACLFEDSREGQAPVCEVEPRGNYLGFLQAHVLGTADCLRVKRVPLLSNILQSDFFFLFQRKRLIFRGLQQLQPQQSAAVLLSASKA